MPYSDDENKPHDQSKSSKNRISRDDSHMKSNTLFFVYYKILSSICSCLMLMQNCGNSSECLTPETEAYAGRIL